jgi:hypothetical protein
MSCRVHPSGYFEYCLGRFKISNVKRFLLSAFVLVFPFILQGQDVEIKGTVRDSDGEALYLANILILPDSFLTSSDVTGHFTVHIKPALKNLLISYTGFRPVNTTVRLFRDTTLHFVLTPRVDQLEAVVIEEQKFSNQDLFESTLSGMQVITQNDLMHMPSFMGQPDVLKAVQLLPGAAGGVEGTSDFFVRGGAADQNLVLLDGAPIYNPGHLLGFLSVFNPDILDKVEAIHGGFPAAFGGRLSSVLNVTSISRLADQTRVSADIGLIASRVRLEQPIAKGKASFWIAARNSYVDKVVQQLTDKEVPYSFHELNGKLILHPTRFDQMEMSHYGGADFLDFLRDDDGDGRGMKTTYRSKNSSQTFKWRHASQGNWKTQLSMFHTLFAYDTRNAYKEDYEVLANSDIEDFGAKLSFDNVSPSNNATISTGLEWTRHEINPKVLNSEGSITDVVESGSTEAKIVQEIAAYMQREWNLMPKLILNAGLRASMALTPSNKYFFPEPRLSARYDLGRDRALKLSYSRMVQYLHRISNSAVSTPIDVWFPVTDSIRPQTAHQLALGWQRFVPFRKVFFSLEGYYKRMEDLVTYEEGTNFLFKSDFESRLVQGSARAYGLEFLIRKETGKFTGWISYSLSWSWRRYDEINNGQWFRARYDRRHNGAIVAQYAIGKRWMASLVWEYISGARFTPVVGQYLALAPNGTGLDLIPEFSPINSVKLADSHRLDVGLKLFSKPGNKFKWNFSVGVYNAYNRATPFGIVIKQNKLDNSLSYSQPGLFGLLPFVSYGCKI